ncbi:MAG: GH36 C-terminal domain-containing protein [Armatimonadetes bacterium]|nr:GH36 C-terminal domain-containing protein [Armatimonadota bacterium]
MSPEVRDLYLRYANIYKTFIRPLLATCKVYHHTPVSSRGRVASSPWFAMEYASPDRTKGWATIVRNGGTSDNYVFKPKGLDSNRTYRVTYDSTNAAVTINGDTLLQSGLQIGPLPVTESELLLFEAV